MRITYYTNNGRGQKATAMINTSQWSATSVTNGPLPRISIATAGIVTWYNSMTIAATNKLHYVMRPPAAIHKKIKN